MLKSLQAWGEFTVSGTEQSWGEQRGGGRYMREGTEPEGLVGHLRESGLYPWGRGMPMDVSQELE